VYVIIIGGGRVGYYLARDLSERGEEVTLVERDGSRAEWLESQLGSIVMRGDGDEMRFLESTGIERADVVLAVTADDEDNLIALQLAKRHFNVSESSWWRNNAHPDHGMIFVSFAEMSAIVSATPRLVPIDCAIS